VLAGAGMPREYGAHFDMPRYAATAVHRLMGHIH
jgi:hypothetical protein